MKIVEEENLREDVLRTSSVLNAMAFFRLVGVDRVLIVEPW